MTLFIYQYYLAVPESLKTVADAISPNLGNPDGISIDAGWQRYPQSITGEGIDQTISYSDPAEWWVASFLATENVEDVPYQQPSKQALEGALSANSNLNGILWWRCDRNGVLQAKNVNTGGVIGQSWGLSNVVVEVENG